MSAGDERKKLNGLDQEVKEMNIKAEDSVNGDAGVTEMVGVAEGRRTTNGEPFPKGVPSPHNVLKKSASSSPIKQLSAPQSPPIKSELEQTAGGDITVKMEPGQAPKLSRTASKKILSKPPILYLDLPDKTSEATSLFEPITDCIYANKLLGTTDHALECDCAEEWDPANSSNHACGEDSDCINRATKMECIGDCDCGSGCQNQRFQRRQYATVSVIKTEKKGYGLRAETDLRPGQFIFEYIGEVIGEHSFRRRMQLYDQEGIKHFYFMSLSKGEFVDATKKGNLGRFCNHSCNPNCYVDKWVVGDKLRMGIFAERKITTGEELVFNYNVDRYGADPQPCYCGEPNCTGFIGGKTQTDRATKLSALTIEALGLEDADDWDLATSKKPRKKKTGEDDEEYVDSMQPRSLDESGVTKVMATLMQCKEKWIAVKLLSRIQRCEEDKVRNRVVKMHGYQILNSTLSAWIEDANVVLQILDILDKLPRLTRNKIQDSKIESTVEKLTTNENEEVKVRAAAILKIWAGLEVGYRIPRIKRDPAAMAAAAQAEREERRRAQRERSKSRSESPDAPKGPAAPTGPRSGIPARTFTGPRPPFRRPFPPSLPLGWFSAQSNGQTYYYSADGQTTWTRPTAPAAQPPPPPKVMTNEQKLQEIINSITKKETSTPKDVPSESNTPQSAVTPKKSERKEKTEKWRSYNEEKKMKLYENTLFPHIKHVMDKYKGKLAKDDLKRFAKEAGKALVKSDFKHKRVDDPTQITARQEKQVKKYVKEYFDKAVSKKKEHDRRKAERRAKEEESSAISPPTPALGALPERKDESDQEDVMAVSEDEGAGPDEDGSPSDSRDQQVSPDMDLKRKAEEILAEEEAEAEYGPMKRSRQNGTPLREAPPPPPPPPPPPANNGDELPDVDPMEQDGVSPLDDTSRTDPADTLKSIPEHVLSNKPSFDGIGFMSATNITPDSPSDRPDTAMDMSNTHIEHINDDAPSHFATPPSENNNSNDAKLHQSRRVDIRQES